MCDALIDRQIVHIYHVKFNIVNKICAFIYIYIQLSCIILIDIVVHYDYSISTYIHINICSNLRLPKKITAGFHRFLTDLPAVRQSHPWPFRMMTEVPPRTDDVYNPPNEMEF